MVGAQRDYRRVTPIPNSSSSEADITPPIQAPKIRDYTTKEKLKVIAGSVTALVIVGWFVVFALALMSAPWVILDRTGLSVSLPLFPKSGSAADVAALRICARNGHRMVLIY